MAEKRRARTGKTFEGEFIVTRYLNGKEISAEELYQHKVSNPVLDRICKSVVGRLQTQLRSTDSPL